MEVLLYLAATVVAIFIGVIILLFAIKNPKIEKVFFVLTLLLGLMSSTVANILAPSGYISTKILTYCFGLLCLLGTYFYFGVENEKNLGKILVTVSALGGLYKCFFIF